MKEQDLRALFTPDVIEDIIQGATKNSVAMQLFRRLPNMTSKKLKMRVLDMLPTAYWVDNSVNNGRKGLTKMAWDNKWIVAEELAVIIPIKQEYLDDADIDIWAQAKPRIVEAFGKKFDQAVFGGVDKPSSFRADLLTSVVNAGGLIIPEAGETLYSQIDRAMAFVEENDYEPTALLGGLNLKSAFRNMLDSTGQPLATTEIGNLTRHFVSNGAWDKTIAKMIVGDFSQAVYSIRQDVEVKILEEAIIQDPATGDILYNLAQEDMVALRMTFRAGWEIPNPINAENPDEHTRFPFAAISAKSAEDTIVTNDITFNVNDGADAIEGAKIVFAGMMGKTDSEGKAVFKAQDGTYKYTVKSDNFNAVKGETDVSGEAVEITVALTKR